MFALGGVCVYVRERKRESAHEKERARSRKRRVCAVPNGTTQVEEGSSTFGIHTLLSARYSRIYGTSITKLDLFRYVNIYLCIRMYK